MRDNEPDENEDDDLKTPLSSAYLPKESDENGKESKGRASIEADRRAARRALRDVVTGRREAQPGQMAGIKMLLAGELEPERDPNPYAGLGDAELIERLITVAASVVGVKALSQMLINLAGRGEADVLGGLTTFDYQPPETDSPPEEESKIPTKAEDDGPQDLP